MVIAPRVRYLTEFHDSARWDGFAFREGDIIISTPAKCGTTWTQTICALLIFGTVELDHPLSRISPWFEMLTRPRADVVADLDAQTHRRFVKSHTPLDGLPSDERVTYITVGRDPRDVAVSNAHHDDNFDDDAFARARRHALGLAAAERTLAPPAPRDADEKQRFWEFVDDASPPESAGASLWRTLHHLETFWDARDRPNVVLLHYTDMVDDLDNAMRTLAGRLGIAVDESRWPELVQAATFGAMRSRAERLAPNTEQGLWRDPAEFFHSGTNGQWRALLDEADLRRYRARVTDLVPDAVARWAHHGDW